MKTLYAACLSRLGLSQSGAATLHGVRIDTVKSWASGRNPVPQGAWEDLREYETQIVDGAEEFREQWDAAGQPPIEINDSEGGGPGMMAVADFVLGSTGPLTIGMTRATQLARQARRPN